MTFYLPQANFREHIWVVFLVPWTLKMSESTGFLTLSVPLQFFQWSESLPQTAHWAPWCTTTTSPLSHGPRARRSFPSRSGSHSRNFISWLSCTKQDSTFLYQAVFSGDPMAVFLLMKILVEFSMLFPRSCSLDFKRLFTFPNHSNRELCNECFHQKWPA